MPTKSPADSAQIQKKAAVIADIKARLESADAAVLTEYRGLTVTAIAELRAALRPAATDYKVFKNTLARKAATDAGISLGSPPPLTLLEESPAASASGEVTAGPARCKGHSTGDGGATAASPWPLRASASATNPEAFISSTNRRR